MPRALFIVLIVAMIGADDHDHGAVPEPESQAHDHSGHCH
jgi:hypothetical protein